MLKKLMVAALLATTAGVPGVGQVEQRKSDIVVTAQKGRAETAVFGKRPFMRQPTMSPDGSKIAVMMSANGVDNLGWIDLASPEKPNFFARAEEFREAGDRTIAAWRWVGNRTIVFTLASREIIGGQRGDVTRLVAYDVETKKLTPIAWDGAGGGAGTIVSVDHDKERFLLSRTTLKDFEFSPGPELIDVDVRTGKFTIVQRPNVFAETWLVDGTNTVRASTGTAESGKERLMYRSGPDGVLKTMANEKDPTFTSSNITPEIFLRQPDIALATSNKSGFRKAYRINMQTMELSEKPVFEVPGHDIDEGGLIPNRARNGLLGVGYTDTKDRIKWFDPKLAQIQAFFDEDFGKDNAILVSADYNYDKLIMRIGEPHEPGGYFLYDVPTGKMNLLGWIHPVLKDAPMNPMETIRYRASDGMEIPAVVTYPRHRKDRRNLPVVIMPHGGPFGVRDLEEFGFFPWHQAMAELGYVVIQPNYRGSGGYGKEFVKEGRKPDGYGKRMQDDLNDAVTHFASAGLIDKNRACIMGWSYGGYATARGAQRDPDVWKCAIAGAGVYDFPMMKAFDTNTFGSFGASFQATSDNLIEISSARNPGGRWSPILIVAGLRDARIPIEQSRTLVSRLKGAGKKEGVDFRYIEQPKGTHNLPYEDVHIEWLVEAENWLRKYNPAYIASDPDKEPPVVITAVLK